MTAYEVRVTSEYGALTVSRIVVVDAVTEAQAAELGYTRAGCLDVLEAAGFTVEVGDASYEVEVGTTTIALGDETVWNIPADELDSTIESFMAKGLSGLAYQRFSGKVIRHFGYAPAFTKCARCGAMLTRDQDSDLCDECYEAQADGTEHELEL